MVLAADASSLASGRCRIALVDPIRSFDRSLPRDYSSTTGPRPGSAPFWITHSNALRVCLSLALSSLSSCVLYTLATFRSSLFPSLFLFFHRSFFPSFLLFSFPSSRLFCLVPIVSCLTTTRSPRNRCLRQYPPIFRRVTYPPPLTAISRTRRNRLVLLAGRLANEC